jgi:hypothetical protein
MQVVGALLALGAIRLLYPDAAARAAAIVAADGRSGGH